MSVVPFQAPEHRMAQPRTQGERVATLESWASQHEQRCEERMNDMKDLFVEVKGRITRLELAIWAALLSFAGWAATQLWAAVT